MGSNGDIASSVATGESTSSSSRAAQTLDDPSACPHISAHLVKSHALVENSTDPLLVSPANKDANDEGPGLGVKSKVDMMKRYTSAVRWGSIAEGYKRRKTVAPECGECETVIVRPWACLTCSFTGCSPLSTKQCMRTHWESSSNCSFAVDPPTGAVFCNECDDTIYPDTFEALSSLTRVRVEEAADVSREGNSLASGRGRGRGAYRVWNGEADVEARIKAGLYARLPCRGLRPLLNLSQTCFLSAILQALIHNPLLRAYFLSDKHNRHVCTNGSRGLAVGRPVTEGPLKEKGCMCCEMDRAFEEFYGGDRSPFGPITMLYSMWHASAELEGHGQQDQIHAHAKGQLSSCNCIAHQTFAGSLQSTVTCSKCKSPSTTVDPILDIQLDFPPSISSNVPSNLSQSSASSLTGGSGGGGGDAEEGEITLASLLRRFCADEKVGDGRGYDCAQCGGGEGVSATRKLLIKKLPPVLSFQLKRFAHGATSSKIETPVRFPSHLDMRPYVEHTEHRLRKIPQPSNNGSGTTVIDGEWKEEEANPNSLSEVTQSSETDVKSTISEPNSQSNATFVPKNYNGTTEEESVKNETNTSSTSTQQQVVVDRIETLPLPDSVYAYDLFAVVTHEGKLDNGHYWADVLTGDEWWHCDDDKVTPTTLGAVLSQRAYMLFYVKRSLAYAEPMSRLLGSVGAANSASSAAAPASATNTVAGGSTSSKENGLGSIGH